MANTINVLTFRQIETYKAKTTARRLREYLHSGEGEADHVTNYLAFLRLVILIYSFFPTLNRQIDPLDYREELINIYKVRNWTPYMMASFLTMKGIFAPREWVLLWRFYQKRTQKDGMEELSELQVGIYEVLSVVGAEMFALYGEWCPEVDDPEGAACRGRQ